MSMEDTIIAALNDDPEQDAERDRAMREGDDGESTDNVKYVFNTYRVSLSGYKILSNKV